jgi:hypothetical protein
METILKSFSLGFLLRSIFAGTFFVLAYDAATKNTLAEIHVNAGNVFSFGMVFALVSGVTVYGIHRSAIYPMFEWAIDSNRAKRWRKCGARFISDNVIHDLVERWDRKAKKADRHAKMHCRVEQITVWADYIHLQYTSAWCILTGYWVGGIIGQPCHMPYWMLFVAIAGFFVFIATVSAWRSRSVEEHWEELPSHGYE